MSYYIETYQVKEKLENEFLKDCRSFKKKSRIFGQTVKAKVNYNTNTLTCLVSTGIVRGDILFDPLNKFWITITLISKQTRYSNPKLSSNESIDLYVCKFKRVKEA